MTLIYNSLVGVKRRRLRKTTATEVATLEAVKLRRNFFSIRTRDGWVDPE